MEVSPCPGKYCGRTELENNTWSECGACPRGFRTNGTFCLPCHDLASPYDWLYLLFIAVVPLILHWVILDYVLTSKSLLRPAFYFIPLYETILASYVTLITYGSPYFPFLEYVCQSRQLADWYTLFHNPNPNYEYVLHCSQEGVYPLYSLVFIFYAYSTLFVLIRLMVTCRCKELGTTPIYFALYFYPILAALHAMLGGIIYYSYPYIMIVGSLISIAVHFARKEEQSMQALIITTMTNGRNMLILLGHWLMHAFGILAVAAMKDLFHFGFLGLVPIPTFFYILTAKFTDPAKYHLE